MAIMKKDVNFGLIMLVIATLVAFAGFATYYSATFQNLTDNYQSKLSDLEKVTEDLLAHRAKLNETSFELEIKQARETDLTKKFLEERSEKTKLQEDKKNLQSELAVTRTEVIDKTNTITALEHERAELNLEIERNKRRIDDLEDETDRLCDKLKVLGESC